MDKKWLIDDFRTALQQFTEALQTPATSNLIKAGCIQYFEFCFELAWKSIKVANDELGLPECTSPKSCLKSAFAQGWIESEEPWLEMLLARNRMAHTYDAATALAVYDKLKGFQQPLEALCMHFERMV